MKIKIESNFNFNVSSLSYMPNGELRITMSKEKGAPIAYCFFLVKKSYPFPFPVITHLLFFLHKHKNSQQEQYNIPR